MTDSETGMICPCARCGKPVEVRTISGKPVKSLSDGVTVSTVCEDCTGSFAIISYEYPPVSLKALKDNWKYETDHGKL